MSLVRGTVSAQGQAWSTSLLRYVDLTVDASGNLLVAGGGGGGGAVDQGTAGSSAWLIDQKKRAVRIDYLAGTDPIYFGLADPGAATSAASWQIRKLTFDGSSNVTAIQYAAGTTAYSSIWDNRASLSYS